ncbi:MAG: protein kinase domain-containing protein [Pirellulaceae bacterium]
MAVNPRVFVLLEEMLESGQSPEEVCRDEPELLLEVRQQWSSFCRIEADFEALLPSSNGPHAMQSTPHPAKMPEIPGYRMDAVLGQGGMGVVYKAWHLRLNRPVALKMLLSGPYARPQELERFLREAEAVAALNHPNIVQIHDSGEVEGRPYFTMELVEGGSLARKLSGTPLSASEAASLMVEVAAAVEAAHRSGIIHRDLKPANILLTADGALKVSDFGLARQQDSGSGITLTGVPLGTPSYMAPEQARGEKDAVSPATDIYSLGAILYECLTGRPPFKAETMAATLQQVLADEPVSPARLNPRVPRDLETICLKCLNKEPHKRYASSQTLADDLGRFQLGEPIKARPVGLVERAVCWVRRRPALAGALASGVLLAAALIATVVWWNGQRAALAATSVAYAEADLSESKRLRDKGDFTASSAVLQRANDRLGGIVPPELHDRLAAAFANLELVSRLDAIRMGRSVLRGKDYEIDTAQADRDYEEVFRSAGLGTDQEEVKIVAARVGDSPARKELVAALDDWAACTHDKRRRAWLLRVVQLADPDSWRDLVRDPDPEAWADRTRLTELTRTAPVEKESVQLLDALGRRLLNAGGEMEAVAYLRRVQQAHPGDFYANNMLGNALVDVDQFGDAVGYFRAALALRPGSTVARGNLGYALLLLQQWDEARVVNEELIRIDPANGWAHVSLGEVLRRQGHTDLAIEHLQRALPLVEPSSRPHRVLAFALQERKRWGEAIHHFRQAAALSPDKAWHQYDLGMALNSPGHQDEAIEYLRKTLALDPRYPAARVNLARILFNRGGAEEAIAELRQAIEIDSTDTPARAELRKALAHLGRWQEVQAAWRKDLDAGPPKHDDWFGYAELCLFLEDEVEYRNARRDLLAQFGSTKDPVVAERTGRAFLLLPAPAEDLPQAVALIERAVAAGRQGREFAHPYCLFAEGLARYRQGRLDDAIKLMNGEAASVMRPSPGIILAMAQHQKGQLDEARKTLAAAIASYDWSAAKAVNHDAWIAHILRREAEAQIRGLAAAESP